MCWMFLSLSSKTCFLMCKIETIMPATSWGYNKWHNNNNSICLLRANLVPGTMVIISFNSHKNLEVGTLISLISQISTLRCRLPKQIAKPTRKVSGRVHLNRSEVKAMYSTTDPWHLNNKNIKISLCIVRWCLLLVFDLNPCCKIKGKQF
jgi:hypothetical protein